MEPLMTPDEADGLFASLTEIVSAINDMMGEAFVTPEGRFFNRADIEAQIGKDLGKAGRDAFVEHAADRGWIAVWLEPPGGRQQLRLQRATV